MADCTIREKEYLGDGLWQIDAVYSDSDGTRSGAYQIAASEKVKDSTLIKAVIALYNPA